MAVSMSQVPYFTAYPAAPLDFDLELTPAMAAAMPLLQPLEEKPASPKAPCLGPAPSPSLESLPEFALPEAAWSLDGEPTDMDDLVLGGDFVLGGFEGSEADEYSDPGCDDQRQPSDVSTACGAASRLAQPSFSRPSGKMAVSMSRAPYFDPELTPAAAAAMPLLQPLGERPAPPKAPRLGSAPSPSLESLPEFALPEAAWSLDGEPADMDDLVLGGDFVLEGFERMYSCEADSDPDCDFQRCVTDVSTACGSTAHGIDAACLDDLLGLSPPKGLFGAAPPQGCVDLDAKLGAPHAAAKVPSPRCPELVRLEAAAVL